jgi:tRNA nucleotidyltransferase/poly(A) polymerase
MSDYLFLMESRLSPEQSRIIGRLQMAAGALGMTLYIAGGAIRDLICGFPIDDLDFVAEGKALQLVRALARDEEFRIVWQSESLQAAELEFPSGAQASINMARSETYSNGTMHASPAPIIVDLKRRDFSINAIGISLNPQSRGLLLDPTNGAGDMERKELRTLHSRSFSDDPSRMFRAVRICHRLHFTMESKTASQFQAAKGARLEEMASGEALLHELRQIARDHDPADILKVLEKGNLLVALNPHLHGNHVNLHGIAQATKATHTLLASGLRPPSFDLFLYLLGAKLGARDRELLSKRLEMK